MLVRDIMRSPVRTVDVTTPLADAYAQLHDHDIRHLPVLDDGALAGIVTDRDLRYATSALHPSPFASDARVAEVMTANPVTAAPLDPVEEAAHVMRARRIGALPVVDGDELVGIVTVTDLLDAIIRLTGLERPSGRVAVDLDDAPGQLARLTALVAEQGANIHSVLSYPEGAAHTRVILRVGTLNTRQLAQALRRASFDVTWPPEKPWSP